MIQSQAVLILNMNRLKKKLDVIVKDGCRRWQQSQDTKNSLSSTCVPLSNPNPPPPPHGACDVSEV